ncbi:MAG TPA: PKD domain-containing protein, partial [Bacteroidia bacterium]|nr:PKD domain-containing protein [Bacteroidia bacterium]
DSVSSIVTVYGHFTFTPMTIQNSNDTVCLGNMEVISLLNSQSGVSYQLRSGLTKIGSAQTGTGSALNFTYPNNIITKKCFNIKATYSNPCYTDTAVVFGDTVYVHNAYSKPAPICTPGNGGNCVYLGITNVTFGSINNTKPNTYLVNNYFDYACCQGTTLRMHGKYPFSMKITGSGYTFAWIDFNGDSTYENNEQVIGGYGNTSGTITIPTTQALNTPVRMRVSADQSSTRTSCGSISCGQTEDYYVIILPDTVLPQASFTYSLTANCVTSASFTNTSYNATSWLWDFGDATTSTLFAPPAHTYTVSGTYKVKLIATNYLGSDTTVQNINIVIPVVPIASVCSPTQTTGVYNPQIITNVFLQSYSVGGGNNFYYDFTCKPQVHLTIDSSYVLMYAAHDAVTGSTSNVLSTAYIDYANDGKFDGPGSDLIVGNTGSSTINEIPFTVPSTAVTSKSLRLRILCSSSYVGSICSALNGNYVDMTVIIDPYPIIYFNISASNPAVCPSDTVYFANTTINGTTWLWDFGDGTTSTAKIPKHVYKNSGVYTVKLKACNSFYCDSTSLINYINIYAVPSITLTGKASICAGAKDTIKASGGTSYKWSTGASTNSIIVAPTSTTTYTLAVTGTMGCVKDTFFIVKYNLKPSVSATATPTVVCAGSATVLNATGASVYTWAPAATLSSTSGASVNGTPTTATTTYSVTGIDTNGCVSSATVMVAKNTLPFVSAIGKLHHVCGVADTLVAHATGKSPFTYLWSNGSTDDTITATLNTTYSVTVTDLNGCTNTGNIAIHDSIPVVPICLVTVDSTSSYIIVIWNDPGCNIGIDSLFIARDSVATNPIARFACGSYSEFVDTTNGINPNLHSYQYNLIGEDSCGMSSGVLTGYAKTIHLTVTPSGCNYNLSWTKYYGYFTFTQYYIYRDSASAGWKLFDSVNSGTLAWTDISCYPGGDNISYYVAVKDPNPCTPSGHHKYVNINGSRSNSANTGIFTGVKQVSTLNNISIYPNPFSNTTSIVFNEDGKHYIEIGDVTGRKLESIECTGRQYELSRNGLAAGVYFIKAFDQEHNYIVTCRIVVE